MFLCPWVALGLGEWALGLSQPSPAQVSNVVTPPALGLGATEGGVEVGAGRVHYVCKDTPQPVTSLMETLWKDTVTWMVLTAAPRFGTCSTHIHTYTEVQV